MKYLDQESAVAKMNALWQEGRRFLFVVSFDKTKSIVLEATEIDPEELLYNLEGEGNDGDQSRNEVDVELNRKAVGYDEFLKAFQTVTDNISYGNSFLTNLTFRTPIETNLSLREIFHHSKARYKLWLKDHFVLFSPESFVKVHNGEISSFPMKGTIDASLPNAENLLLNDQKEMAEHVTIVDLIRNDLSQVANEVGVCRFRYLDHLKTSQKDLLQVSSEIRGKIREEFEDHIGDVIFSLLPAGSITGAPKPQTIDIIRQAEDYERGFYTGVFGICDGKKLDSAVMIRFIEQENNQLFFKSGGGITHFSDAQKEYQEYLDKIYLPIPQPQQQPKRHEVH